MTRRRHLAATAAVSLLVVAGCAGGVRLPPPIAAVPASTTTTTTNPLPPDGSGCVADQLGTRDPAHSPTRSYAPDGPLPAPGAMPAGSPMKAISDRGRLIVGVSADTLLFGSRNPSTGAIEGFDVDVLRAIAAAIFGPDDLDTHLEFRVITYAQRLQDLINGDVDLVAHTMTINCARWQQIAFSSEYFSAGQRVLVKVSSRYDSLQSLVAAKATVCAPEGSTNLDELTPYRAKGLQLTTRAEITDCLVAMQEGKADAASGDDTVLAGFAKQDPTAHVVGDTFTNEPYGIGVNKDQVPLVRFVNAVLEQLRASGQWTSLYEKWLVPTLTPADQPVPAPPVALYGRPLP